MGLTESNQSKGAGGGGGGGWGPSKSRSTPHFPDTRGYQGRPRQAATLPARPTPESGQPPPYAPRTPSHDPQPMGHDPRPPERAGHRENYAHAGRSPCLRPAPPRRSASADSRKRRSDPLLDARTLRQLPQLAPLQRDYSPMSSSPHTPVTPPSTPRLVHRPRPTAIYLADDQAVHLVKQREGRSRDRSRDRGHHGRGPSGGRRSRAAEERRDRSQGSGERRPRATHVTTLTLTPQYPGDSRPQTPMSDCQPRQGHHRRRKGGKKARARTAEVGSTERLQSDPYVCLHYGGSPKDAQGPQAQQMTAWRSEYEQPGVPNSQVSQVVIRMNQVSDATLDNFDAVNANVESVQMRRNVWFHSNCAADTQGDATAKKRSSARTNTTTSVCENSFWDGEQDLIQWPDVTSKVSSVYMRPEMHIAAVSCVGEEQKVTVYSSEGMGGGHRHSPGSATPSHRHRSKGSRSSSRDKFAQNGGGDYVSIVPRGEQVAERPNQKALEDEGVARHFSIYDDRRNYSRAPGRRKKTPSGLRRSEDTPTGEGGPSSPSYTCVTDAHASRWTGSEQDLNPAGNAPPLPPRKGQRAEREAEGAQGRAVVEVKFGLQNHVEDFTIIEATRDESRYYGCGDSDAGEGEGERAPGTASCGGRFPPPLQGAHPADTRNTSECSDAGDNTSTFCDKIDKDTTTDSNYRGIDSSLSSLGRHGEPSERASMEDVMPTPDDGTAEPPSRSPCQEGGQVAVEAGSPVCDVRSRPNESGKAAGKTGAMFSKDSRGFLEPGGSYRPDTVSGSPSALLFSHKCLNHSTTLPRRQSALGRVADSGTSDGGMKPFRNRFRSFDAGHFPVLRLPLGNQPKLVDVLRACAAKEGSPPPALDPHHGGSVESLPRPDHVDGRRQSKADSIDHFYVDTLCDDVTSWPQCHDAAGAKAPPQGPDAGLRDEPSIERLGEAAAGDRRNIPHLPLKKALETRDASSTWGASNGRLEQRSARTWHSLGRPTEGPLQRHPGPLSRGDSLAFRREAPEADPGGGDVRSEEGHPAGNAQAALALPHLARHSRKRALTRPSVRAIAWDTPAATPTATPGALADCSYTCHEQCQDLVTLDCKADLTPDSNTSHEELYVESAEEHEAEEEDEEEACVRVEEVKVEVEEEEEGQEENEEEEEKVQEEQEEKHEEEQQEKELKDELVPFKKSEEVSTLRKTVSSLQSHLVDNDTLEEWVERYNASAQGLQIAKESDGSYRGCVRVHLNLSRPINIVAGTRPPSIYDILQEDRTMEKTLTSFYMPRDAVKAIHITSKTTTREVIVALLRKFKVVDNPQKFALYERNIDSTQSGKARLRRLGDGECPLVLALNWSAGGLTNKRLVLQENDTADIQWEAFSLPELSNFLRILDREEEEYRCQIQDKYALLRRRIHNILIQQEAE
ncbi:uncharacterized protein [Penaeus vannamei]|uniref:uncharacterized protein n=1 Tax=Penaeus vannamei TaxID=6689 RepID=UPI00387F8E2D